jgi:hypothetical protein
MSNRKFTPTPPPMARNPVIARAERVLSRGNLLLLYSSSTPPMGGSGGRRRSKKNLLLPHKAYL